MFLTKEISTTQLKNFKEQLESRKDHRVLTRTVSQNGIFASSRDQRADINSVHIPSEIAFSQTS